MASFLYCNSNNDNRVRDSWLSSHGRIRRSCSKAQACLEKILHIISTTPPPSPFKKLKPGFDIDLNLRLGSFLDDDDNDDEGITEEGKSESLAENSFVGKNPDGEEEEEKTATAATATATDESSDLTEMQKSGGGGDGEVKAAAAAAFNDSLGLLIEAAEMISDKDKEVAGDDGSMERNEDEEEDENDDVEEERRKVAKVVEELEEETLPVVRSNRGRNQVLPRRFRDSVLEPWKKNRPQTQRSAAMVSNKRKRRPR